MASEERFAFLGEVVLSCDLESDSGCVKSFVTLPRPISECCDDLVNRVAGIVKAVCGGCYQRENVSTENKAIHVSPIRFDLYCCEGECFGHGDELVLRVGGIWPWEDVCDEPAVMVVRLDV